MGKSSVELPSTQPGYFQIFLGPADSGWYFQCNCPCGCKYGDIVPIELEGEDTWHRTGWHWDGDLERPTLTPSLRRTGTACKIHFNVTKGQYIIHPDGAPAAQNIYRAP
jgi:Family of unknown function (DUF6527)